MAEGACPARQAESGLMEFSGRSDLKDVIYVMRLLRSQIRHVVDLAPQADREKRIFHYLFCSIFLTHSQLLLTNP